MSRLLIIAVLLGVAVAPRAAEKLYRWVDDRGVVHYGDSVPAEDTSRERHVLNDQGVLVRKLPREKTQEERAAEAAALAEQERQRMELVRQKERDQILLDTYLSVDEIAMLRDRRVLALDAQIGVTRHYLKNLQATWEELEAEARKYNFPFDENSDLPPLPDDLAQHIIHTEKAMAEHMQTVQALRREQATIRDDFARDMSRFKELTASVEADRNRSQP